MTQDYSDYIEFTDTPVPASGFEGLDKLIEQQRQAEAEVERLEEELRQAKKKLVDVSERQIPDLMDEMGFEEFVTKSGFKIQVKKTLRCSIGGDKKEQAIAWLKEHGHGDIVKRTVQVPFLVGQEDAASQLLSELRERFGTASEEAKVEPQTLKALLTKLLKEGKEIPMETFGTYEQRQAKISVVKK